MFVRCAIYSLAKNRGLSDDRYKQLLFECIISFDIIENTSKDLTFILFIQLMNNYIFQFCIV